MTLPYSTQAGKLAFQEATGLYRSLNYRIGDFKALRGLSADLKQLSSIRTGARAATNPISSAYKQLEFDIKDGKKVTDGLKSGNWKNVGGKFASFMTLAFAALSVFGAIIGVVNSRAITQLSAITVRQFEVQGREFAIQFRLIEKTFTGLRNVSKTVDKLVKEQKEFVDRTYAEATKSNRGAIEARQKANDALYEVRAGRKILEDRISSELQKANARVAELNTRITNTLKNNNNNIVTSLQNTVSSLQNSLSQSNRNVEAANNEIKRLSTRVDKTETVTRQLPATIQRVTNASQDTTVKAVDRAFETIQQVNKRWGVTVTPVTITPATVNVSESGGVTVTPASVTPARVTFSDFSTSDLGLQIRVNQERQQSNITSQLSALGSAISNVGGVATNANNKADLALNEAKNKGIVDFTPVNAKIKEIERVNEQGNRKLDDILGKVNSIIPVLALIPARAAQQIKQDMPSVGDIEAATGRAMCRNLQTGCGRKAIDDAIGNITNNVNQHNTNNTGSVLDALNTGANAAQITLLNTINGKLGDAIPGGIGGKLNKLASWLQLDRLLNLLTFAATVHNAAQLTSDIAVTLGSALSNVLSLIGIKNDDGSAIDIGQIINSTVENLVKGIIGESQYKQFSEAWAKANRIYQATTNVANSFTNIGHTILNGLEIVGGNTGKIGNALRIWGAVGENAYNWMNPQPNYHSRIFQFFEKAQNTASTVQQVTQVPLDVISSVTEFNNSTKELVDSVTQKPETTQGQDVGDAETVKEQRDAAKIASVGAVYDITDLFDAND
ncbi:hypothetical protein [Nostoc sp. CMAA1605]|uniref:hypothetical protein n=1 Tax=Nostoc sp. CMAA1605 TaxID=2055159 RepID=UPI001F24AC92|nr:hypothetical protein [Nostoc sp. CMAA1605]MCF4968705.1 hypothetical protein [Nostoc sp. CMAA1605]